LGAAARLWEHASDGQGSGHGDGARVLVNLSAGTAPARWPAERYVAVLQDTLARRPGLCVLVIGMARDTSALREIAATTGCATACPRLRDTLALVESADLLLTPDTGLVHAASAFRTPVVAMYHRGAATHWGPYRTVSPGVVRGGRALRPPTTAPLRG